MVDEELPLVHSLGRDMRVIPGGYRQRQYVPTIATWVSNERSNHALSGNVSKLSVADLYRAKTLIKGVHYFRVGPGSRPYSPCSCARSWCSPGRVYKQTKDQNWLQGRRHSCWLGRGIKPDMIRFGSGSNSALIQRRRTSSYLEIWN